MYAIIKNKGKQYRVSEGEEILFDKLEGDIGKKIEFDDILLMGGTKPKLKPELGKAKIKGTVLEHLKGSKVIVFKFKPKKGYKKKNGHRQDYTKVRIDSISLGEKAEAKVKKAALKPEAAVKESKRAAPKVEKKAVSKALAKPTVKRGEKKPASKTAAKTTAKATTKTTQKVETKPAAKATKKPAEKKTTKPVTKKKES